MACSTFNKYLDHDIPSFNKYSLIFLLLDWYDLFHISENKKWSWLMDNDSQ